MRKLGQMMTVLIALAISAGILHAARNTAPAQKCAAAKIKAIGKKIASELKCYSHAVAKGFPGICPDPNCGPPPDCVIAASQKFNDAMTRAEASGGCQIVGDGPTLELLTDRHALSFVRFAGEGEILGPIYGCCTDTIGLCWYEADPNATGCTGFTRGDPNSVCDSATGNCVPPGTPTPGLSCDSPAGYVPAAHSICFGGPENGGGLCEAQGGTSHANSLCPPYNEGNNGGFAAKSIGFEAGF